MKRLLLIIATSVAIAFSSFAQDSKGFSFQGIARDAGGAIFGSSAVNITTSLLNGSTIVYSETQALSTDAYGVFSIIIGKGTQVGLNAFSTVDFSLQLNVKIDISIAGGATTTIANYALQSVPYSKYAVNATHAVNADNATNATNATHANNADNATNATNANYAKNSTIAENGSPVGTVVAFAGPIANIPGGWLLCNGSNVSRTAYAALFAAIGTSWGYGDNATSFNLPDMRGQFLRGVDQGAKKDPDAASRTASQLGGNSGDNVGSAQGHQVQIGAYIGGGNSRGLLWGGNYAIGNYKEVINEYLGGNENRPRNVDVYYIIKY